MPAREPDSHLSTDWLGQRFGTVSLTEKEQNESKKWKRAALMGPGDWWAVPVAGRELLAVKVGPERLVRTPPVHRGRGPP